MFISKRRKKRIFGALRKHLGEIFHELAGHRESKIVEGHATAYGVKAEINYDWGYPATINHEDEADFAAEVAREGSGEDAGDARAGREMGSEDFRYMRVARPGAACCRRSRSSPRRWPRHPRLASSR